MNRQEFNPTMYLVLFGLCTLRIQVVSEDGYNNVYYAEFNDEGLMTTRCITRARLKLDGHDRPFFLVRGVRYHLSEFDSIQPRHTGQK